MFLVDFNKIWNSLAHFNRSLNIEFHVNPPSGSCADIWKRMERQFAIISVERSVLYQFVVGNNNTYLGFYAKCQTFSSDFN